MADGYEFMEYEFIEYEVTDPVATIRLNRPERLNALTYPLMVELRDAVDRAAADPAVVGIVITGNGRGFCAGLDSADLVAVTSGSGGGDRREPADGEVPGLFTYLLSVPKPVIAAVNGAAAGGGVVLATMCDVRFASPAAAFVTVFGQRGLLSEHGTTWTIPRLVGTGRALDLLWSSRRVGGEEAARIGLVEYLVEPGDLVTAAQDYVRLLAATVSPASMADTKELVYRHAGAPWEDALREAERAPVGCHRPPRQQGGRSVVPREAPPDVPASGFLTGLTTCRHPCERWPICDICHAVNV